MRLAVGPKAGSALSSLAGHSLDIADGPVFIHKKRRLHDVQLLLYQGPLPEMPRFRMGTGNKLPSRCYGTMAIASISIWNP
jgi:hypothetical protein